jgi:GTP cyclohydrolase I
MTIWPAAEGYRPRRRAVARRLQVHEHLTKASRIGSSVKGIASVLEAEHLCMSLRRLRAPDSQPVDNKEEL